MVRLDQFHLTTELLTKFVPVTVNVKEEPPAVVELGLMLESVGTGLLIVSARDALPVPPAFVALMVTVVVLATVGVPEIRPVVVLTTSPDGRPVAP